MKLRLSIATCACALLQTSAFTVNANELSSTVSDPSNTQDLGNALQVHSAPAEIKIMSYNVQNLFDNRHDENKRDHTWLPKGTPGKTVNCQKQRTEYYRKQCLETHWTAAKIKDKLAQIKKSIAVQGSLPDLLAVQEIENENVTQQLAKALGYDKYLITNSPDKRGIDVALLYNENKLAYIEHEEIDVSESIGFATRNILRVHFRPLVGHKQGTLGVYVNHWPSQATRAHINPARVKAAVVLRKNIQKHIDDIGKENYYVVATGDFNTLTNEIPNAFFHGIQDPKWENYLQDVQALSEKRNNPMTFKMPRGTYWYQKDGRFNRFDRFLISKNLTNYKESNTLADIRSFRIVGNPVNSVLYSYRGRVAYHQLPQQWVPRKYNFRAETNESNDIGFSDHYPILMKIRFQTQ